uniref:Uncharacterized protein n=1 Tax=Plectus sambesii TaxID=2011161 RepID=A0A914WAN1_9BILA
MSRYDDRRTLSVVWRIASVARERRLVEMVSARLPFSQRADAAAAAAADCVTAACPSCIVICVAAAPARVNGLFLLCDSLNSCACLCAVTDAQGRLSFTSVARLKTKRSG